MNIPLKINHEQNILLAGMVFLEVYKSKNWQDLQSKGSFIKIICPLGYQATS